ncbi:MAG: formate--phosphoribosylaminoimidazolecarboxamide ligase family protein, partial [Candidatus Bathyarchaeia archaeon]
QILFLALPCIFIVILDGDKYKDELNYLQPHEGIWLVSEGCASMDDLLEGYDASSLTIATLGSHSALDICKGAKAEGLRTLVVCEARREKVYATHYKSRTVWGRPVGVVDETVVIEKFAHVTRANVVQQLRRRNCIFIPHRSFTVYVPYDAIEKQFPVPMFGNRWLLRVEERDSPMNQYHVLEKANIRTPKRFTSPEAIDRLTIVKVAEAERPYERAFFYAANEADYKRIASDLLKRGAVTEAALKSAVMEEFVVGAQFNFNFFYSPLNDELELLGVDTRRQTNIDGLLKLPASEQLKVADMIQTKTIEIGHIACTVRESMLEQIFDAGERFVQAAKETHPPGVIGPFALQGSIVPGPPREEIVVFDVSLRVPGSPGTAFTPYSEYNWRTPISVGRRIAMEVKQAAEQNRLAEVVT